MRSWFIYMIFALPDIQAFELFGFYYKLIPTYGTDDNKEETILFKLYTGRNPHHYQQLKVNDDGLFEASYFNRSMRTVIYFTGYMAGEKSDSAYMMIDAYMERTDHNVIFVDWSTLAAGPWYPVAACNVVPVGKYTAELIDYLVSKGAPLESFHLVGMSLGAHAAGITGKHVKSGKLDRVTALDPAGILFMTEDSSERLDASDAKMVDVIHTTSGMGLHDSEGIADFYPNGGKIPQPGCWIVPFGALCSHRRAWKFYAESLSNEHGFLGVSCDSWDDYEEGRCSDNNEMPMGYATHSTARGKYFLKTGSSPPFAPNFDNI